MVRVWARKEIKAKMGEMYVRKKAKYQIDLDIHYIKNLI